MSITVVEDMIKPENYCLLMDMFDKFADVAQVIEKQISENRIVVRS